MENINRVCCDEPGEDCSSGIPATCNQDCASEYIPFYQKCSNVEPFNDPNIAPNLVRTFNMCSTANLPTPTPSPPTPASEPRPSRPPPRPPARYIDSSNHIWSSRQECINNCETMNLDEDSMFGEFTCEDIACP